MGHPVDNLYQVLK